MHNVPLKQGKFENAFKEFVRRGKEQLFDQYFELLKLNTQDNKDSLDFLMNVDASTEDKLELVIKNTVSEKELDNYLKQCWRYNFVQKQLVSEPKESREMSDVTVSNGTSTCPPLFDSKFVWASKSWDGAFFGSHVHLFVLFSIVWNVYFFLSFKYIFIFKLQHINNILSATKAVVTFRTDFGLIFPEFECTVEVGGHRPHAVVPGVRQGREASALHQLPRVLPPALPAGMAAHYCP